MIPQLRSKLILPLLALLMLLAAWIESPLASNMGFKFNKKLYAGFVIVQAPKRDNWISLPYNNPYPDAKKLCVACGAAGAGFTIFQLNPATGAALVNYPCALVAVVPLDASRGVRIRNTGPLPANCIIVGSHDDATPLPTILGGFTLVQAPKKENWISVPYHTTWNKAEDVCVSLGLGPGAGSVIRINPDPAVGANVVSHPCVTVINNFAIRPAEALLIRKTSAGDIVGFIPLHL